LAGRRKVDDGIAPLGCRGPVIVLGSVLTNVHVPPRFHELKLALELDPRATLVPLATARLRVSVPSASA
jgi:hypothetical protein